MKQTIETATDGAVICAFDPAALPGNFDSVVGDDPAGLMERLQSEGRFWHVETGGDGRFVVQVYVDEIAPATTPAIGATRRLISEFPAFSCPSGKLWFCGAEYAANNPANGSAFTPEGGLRASKMDKAISLPVGAHHIKIHRLEKTRENGGGMFSGARLLNAASAGLCIAGLLAAAFALVIFVVGLPVKLYHYLSGNPLADKGWHLYPIALAVLGAGAVCFWAGLQFGRWHGRGKNLIDTAGQPGERPDFEIEIFTGRRP